MAARDDLNTPRWRPRGARALLLLALLAAAPALDLRRPAPASAVLASAGDVAAGDLVYRRGVGPEAALVVAAQGGAGYSHVGIAVRHGGAVWVVHAVPAEAPGERDATKMEPLAAFLAPTRASGAAVYRLDGTPADAEAHGRRAAEAAEAMARQAIPFDAAFDFGSRTAVYCTALVWRAYARAGVDLRVRLSRVDALGLHREILLPDDLIHSPVLHRVL